jgi:predicted alpha/beta superfamily hydrolase
MSKLEDIIQTAMNNLPVKYRSVLKETDIDNRVERIAEANNFDEQATARLDREVSYLVLRMHDTVTFMDRLEKKMGLSEAAVTEITKQVTQQIIQPMQKSVSKQEDEPVPVPPPPNDQQDKPPTPNYGGGSDPYREPPE